MLCHETLILRQLAGFLCMFFRGEGIVLSYQCFHTFLFRALTHLLGRPLLQNGLLALFVRNLLLLVGYLLHLRADAAHDGRPFLLQLQSGHL